MEENLAQDAIKSALDCNYSKAIKINLQILKVDGENIDALNRLSRAYYETGKIIKAVKTSKKVIKIDANNNIAKNSLEKYKSSSPHTNQQKINDASAFIEESGKTKLTSLINLGSEKICSSLNAGEEVYLTPYTHKISVVTKNGAYIGKLADDLSARIKQMIIQDHKYSVLIKTAGKKCVKVFIKTNIISFPLDTSESFGEFSP